MLHNGENLGMDQGVIALSNCKSPLYNSQSAGCRNNDSRLVSIPRAQLYHPDRIPGHIDHIEDKSYLHRKRGRPRKYTTDQRIREIYWDDQRSVNFENSRKSNDSRKFESDSTKYIAQKELGDFYRKCQTPVNYNDATDWSFEKTLKSSTEQQKCEFHYTSKKAENEKDKNCRVATESRSSFSSTTSFSSNSSPSSRTNSTEEIHEGNWKENKTGEKNSHNHANIIIPKKLDNSINFLSEDIGASGSNSNDYKQMEGAVARTDDAVGDSNVSEDEGLTTKLQGRPSQAKERCERVLKERSHTEEELNGSEDNSNNAISGSKTLANGQSYHDVLETNDGSKTKKEEISDETDEQGCDDVESILEDRRASKTGRIQQSLDDENEEHQILDSDKPQETANSVQAIASPKCLKQNEFKYNLKERKDNEQLRRDVNPYIWHFVTPRSIHENYHEFSRLPRKRHMEEKYPDRIVGSLKEGETWLESRNCHVPQQFNEFAKQSREEGLQNATFDERNEFMDRHVNADFDAFQNGNNFRRKFHRSPSHDRKSNEDYVAIVNGKARRLINTSRVANGMSEQRKRLYSEIVDLSSFQSLPSVQENVNDCIECYYESTSIDRNRNSLVGTLQGKYHEEFLRGGMQEAPYQRVSGNWMNRQHIREECGSNTRITTNESVPVIVECFSLSNRDLSNDILLKPKRFEPVITRKELPTNLSNYETIIPPRSPESTIPREGWITRRELQGERSDFDFPIVSKSLENSTDVRESYKKLVTDRRELQHASSQIYSKPRTKSQENNSTRKSLIATIGVQHETSNIDSRTLTSSPENINGLRENWKKTVIVNRNSNDSKADSLIFPRYLGTNGLISGKELSLKGSDFDSSSLLKSPGITNNRNWKKSAAVGIESNGNSTSESREKYKEPQSNNISLDRQETTQNGVSGRQNSPCLSSNECPINSPIVSPTGLPTGYSNDEYKNPENQKCIDIYSNYFSKYYNNSVETDQLVDDLEESNDELIVDVEEVNDRPVLKDNEEETHGKDDTLVKDKEDKDVVVGNKPFEVTSIEIKKRALELEEYSLFQSKAFKESPTGMSMDNTDTWPSFDIQGYQGLHSQTTSKGYVCDHCGREFTHLSSLNNHVRTHTGQKPFKCQFCGKRFAQSGVLTAHLRTHTGDRPFECIICQKRFAQTTTLANHIRTHTGQKPFSCKYCKRKFAQSSTRNKHELSHTKEKPYVCKYCGRSFSQSATVTRHMRIHLRQEAFVCLYCGKEFPFLYALDKHLDSHNRENGTR